MINPRPKIKGANVMNQEQGQFLCKVFCDTIQTEFEITKKVIRAIPDDRKGYKPDAKSMSAHELAWHLATAEMFFLDGVINGSFQGGEPPDAPPTVEEILAWYETNHHDRMTKLQNLPGDKVVQSLPFFGVMELPAVFFLNLMNLHTSHHRGQLSTYLRPMGAKVPSIYGGSADEPFQSSASS
jgi:uncharacterized damage-inducible protein DinB